MVCPFTAVFLFSQVEKIAIRKEVKHQLMATESDSLFVRLAFRNDELRNSLRWEHEREFEYRGEMYDVVRSESRNDSTFFTLWWDKEETELNRKLIRLVKAKQGESEETPSQNLLKEFKVIFPMEVENSSSQIAEATRYPNLTIKAYINPFIDPTSPPPEG